MSLPPYLQHARRHGPHGSDPITELTNDWCIATASFGTVTSGSADVDAGFSSLDYQTDDGQVYGIYTGGAIDVVEMKQVGSYLIRARATFPQNRTGNVQFSAVIGGDVTTYDYDTAPGGIHFTDIAPGEGTWEQLCVVNDLSAHAGAYMTFTQTTGSSMVGVGAHLQIFRIT